MIRALRSFVLAPAPAAVVAVVFVAAAGLFLAPAHADDPLLDFQPPTREFGPEMEARMRDLAARILPVYQEKDQPRFLNRLSAFQAVAGNWEAAESTRNTLRDRRRAATPVQPVLDAHGEADLFDIYVHARAAEIAQKLTFAHAFTQTFRDTIGRMGDREAYALTSVHAPFPVAQMHELQYAFERMRAAPRISLADAQQVVWNYFSYEAHRRMAALLPSLAEEDEERRYLMESKVQIRTVGHAYVDAVIVRPRAAATPLPALLEFSIDPASHAAAMESAAHGYVGIVAFTRGRTQVPSETVPFRFDGEDARAVIEWIAKQPWSDGRVGMQGDRYSGFAAWAATRALPAALQAIATSDPIAPGIDFPMQGNIFWPESYRWLVDWLSWPGAPHALDDAGWRSLERAWYHTGSQCAALGEMNEWPIPTFDNWLNHPAYDAYWQEMAPSSEQFAKIQIPVLTMTGYFADGAPGALFYLSRHENFDATANHTLVVAPYDDWALAHGPVEAVRGYRVDPAAYVDPRELRYAWFDHIFKSLALPAVLSDRVNYAVMGPGEWRHAPSIAAMANDNLRLYISTDAQGRGALTPQIATAGQNFIPQTVYLADDREEAWMRPDTMILDDAPFRDNVVFFSAPLEQPLEISGIVTGDLNILFNKRDADFHIALYEFRSDRSYVPLFDPPIEFRASYGEDRAHRHLLHPGIRLNVPFRAERLTSRRLDTGSRLVVAIGVNKSPDRETNYGSGKDVRVETAGDDGTVPLNIRWYRETYVDLPVRK
jgi:putative CocE/NonD family hydrolase